MTTREEWFKRTRDMFTELDKDIHTGKAMIEKEKIVVGQINSNLWILDYYPLSEILKELKI